MNLFTWMLVGHLAGDFLLQSSWMAERKEAEWMPLLTHCFVYTVSVAVFALPAGGISPAAVALIFLAHLVFDKRKLVRLWAKHVSRVGGNNWLEVVQDQSWHIMVLAAATLL